MKIEVKKIQISLALSEETTAFTADIYLNGQKACYAKNGGYGGSTDIHLYDPKFKTLLAEAEAYCKTLPPVNYGNFTHEMDLELFIDEIVNKEAEKKELEKINKKMIKLQETNVLFGVKGGDSYKMTGYGPKYKFAELMKTAEGKQLVARLLKSVLEKMQPGEEILNTNIDFSLPEFREYMQKTGYKPKTV